MPKLPKIYVYVDEAGQDTKGEIFYVKRQIKKPRKFSGQNSWQCQEF